MSDYKKLSQEELRVIREKTGKLADADYSSHKNRFKRIRTVGEILVVLDTVALQCGQRSVNIARSARTTIMDS